MSYRGDSDTAVGNIVTLSHPGGRFGWTGTTEGGTAEGGTAEGGREDSLINNFQSIWKFHMEISSARSPSFFIQISNCFHIEIMGQ